MRLPETRSAGAGPLAGGWEELWDADGEAEDGGPDGGVVVPVQRTPLSVNAVGFGLADPDTPTNAGSTVPLVGSDPFHDALVTVTAEPVWLHTPFQPEPTRWAASGKVK